MTAYRIGQVAARAGMSVEGIRYYERRGLLPRPRRSASGHRLYTDADLRRLGLIKAAQQMGFSLREVAGLLALREEAAAGCAGVRARLAAKLEEIRRRQRLLRALERDLRAGIRRCDRRLGSGDAGPCPVLEELDAGAANQTRRRIPA